MRTLNKLAMVCLLCLCSACAHNGVNPLPGQEREGDHRLRNALIAVGAVVLVAAVVANQAESNAKDALRGIGSNQAP
ncbi:MAG: hypothetical protein AAF671_09670 [Pseudomonadota bacterium]